MVLIDSFIGLEKGGGKGGSGKWKNSFGDVRVVPSGTEFIFASSQASSRDSLHSGGFSHQKASSRHCPLSGSAISL